MLVAALTAALSGRHQVRISLCRSLPSFVFVAGGVAATRDDVGMNAFMAALRETAERVVRPHCCSSSVCCMLISAQAVCVPRFAYRGSARHVKGDMTRGSDAGISRVQHVWCSDLDSTWCEQAILSLLPSDRDSRLLGYRLAGMRRLLCFTQWSDGSYSLPILFASCCSMVCFF